MPRSGSQRIALAHVQQGIERLLEESNVTIGPVDVLEAVADALQNADSPEVADSLRSLIIDLRGYQVGIARASRV